MSKYASNFKIPYYHLPGPGRVYLVPGGVPAQVLPPVNRMRDRYKNITLPQTSFAGSKNGHRQPPL